MDLRQLRIARQASHHSIADNRRDDGEDGQVSGTNFFHMTGRCTRKGHSLHGRDPNFSRIQVKAAGPDPEKPGTAQTIYNDGFPSSFGWTNSADQARGRGFRSSIWRIAAWKMELDRVRVFAADHDQGGHSLR